MQRVYVIQLSVMHYVFFRGTCSIILIHTNVLSPGTLDIDDLHRVQDATWEVRAKWYNCGLALGVSSADLEVIKENHRGDCDNCFRETLIEWLKRAHPPPTWSALCNALSSPSVGHGELAERLSKKH